VGRNADKRKARKGGSEGDKGGQGVHDTAPSIGPAATAGVRASAPPLSAPPAVDEARGLGGDLELPALVDDDGSLARALFRITCLLSVRDTRGVVRENMARVASEVASIAQADTVSILSLESGDDVVPARLVLRAAHGLSVGDEGLVTFDIGDGVAGTAAANGELISIEDAPRDRRFSALYGQRTEIGSLVAAPLVFRGKVLGVVTASRKEIRAFAPMDVERIKQVASAIAQDMEQTTLLHHATIDPLTVLGSRLALLIALPREVEVSRRYHADLSLLVLDIDGLDAVNQQHGRVVGDRVLVESARRLRAALRAADLPVRLGGDELAVLLPMTSSNNARALAKRLTRTLAAPIGGGAATIDVKWSVGTATLGADEDALSLLWRADDALAQAKTQGGDAIVTAPSKRAAVE
jgi:diguanylate cyclase (GGDEF)-like protein